MPLMTHLQFIDFCLIPIFLSLILGQSQFLKSSFLVTPNFLISLSIKGAKSWLILLLRTFTFG